jgi:NAD-dependent SIR2 family protein deacetylase
VWTRKAQGRSAPSGKSTLSAWPTATHMSLVELQRRGLLQYLVSQNTDGLHRRSGFPSGALSELHGNGNVEECEDCGQQYYRDAKCRRSARGRDHFTGRHCVRTGCGGRLLEYTIDFGQTLPEAPLEKAMDHASKANLCIALGSSLRVTPAADIPAKVGTRGRDGAHLVIINLQKTPLTDVAAFQIYAKTDVVMTQLMAQMALSILPFRLRRCVELHSESHTPGALVTVRGIDVEDDTLPASVLKGIRCGKAGTPQKEESVIPATQAHTEETGASKHTILVPAHKVGNGFPRLLWPLWRTSCARRMGDERGYSIHWASSEGRSATKGQSVWGRTSTVL